MIYHKAALYYSLDLFDAGDNFLHWGIQRCQDALRCFSI